MFGLQQVNDHEVLAICFFIFCIDELLNKINEGLIQAMANGLLNTVPYAIAVIIGTILFPILLPILSFENKYPMGVLQTTMSEDKKTLKERLVSIMKYNEKSKTIIIISSILFAGVILRAMALGAGVGTNKENAELELDTPQNSTYNLVEISKYKTPYVGDNSKVATIVSNLPIPDNYFNQQFISMNTSEKPYALTLYYEAASDIEYEGEWPIITPDTIIETNSMKNALVLFSMIDNLDEVTFAYRISQSNGNLDFSKYDTTFMFQRTSFEDKYGYVSTLSKDLDLLEDALKETKLTK